MDSSRFRRVRWGLTGVWFAVLTVVAAVLVGQIPSIGPVLVMMVIAASLIVWFRSPFVDQWSYVPSPVTDYVPIALDQSEEVVGESHYQREIYDVLASHGRDVWAVLTHEPRNPHDRNAVRVDLVAGTLIRTCGYLPRGRAEAWVPLIREYAVGGKQLRMDAVIRGGTGSARFYGVWLTPARDRSRSSQSVRSRGSRRPRFERVDDDVRSFWSRQVPSGGAVEDSAMVPAGVVDLRGLESRRLRLVGTTYYLEDGERVLDELLLLEREPHNKHDENAIAVTLLSGRRVGYVSASQAESYAPLLDPIGTRFLVTRFVPVDGDDSGLRIDVPRVPALRAFTTRGR